MAGLAVLAAVVATTLAVTPSAFGWTVQMTAQPQLKRAHTWAIQKTVGTPTLTLKAGESATVEYSVTVTHTGSTDSDWAVTGNVSYSADSSITLGGIDIFATPPAMFGPTTSGSLTGCSQSPFPITLVSGLTCGYSIALPNANPGDAHATATVVSPAGGRHVSAPFDFSTATVSETDECVSVSDTLAGNLGTVCVGDAPKTFTYEQTIGPFSGCGQHTINNTAAFVTNDTGTTGNSSASVDVTVLCDAGCTRTIGYWKNHAGLKKQADVVTALLPIWLGTAAGAKSVLVDSNIEAVQYLEMKGTNNVHDSENGINKLYAQLLGAKLNIASGTGTASIASVVAAADAFLATNNTLDWAGLTAAQQSQVLSWMTSLDNWNNGLAGPAHCD